MRKTGGIFPGSFIGVAGSLDAPFAPTEPSEVVGAPETPSPADDVAPTLPTDPRELAAMQQAVIETRFQEFIAVLGAEIGQPLGAILVLQTQHGAALGAISLAQVPARLQLGIVDAIVNRLHEISRSIKVRINSITKV